MIFCKTGEARRRSTIHRPRGAAIARGFKAIFALTVGLSMGVGAQWTTQQIELKAGWNGVFLHIDPSHQSLDDSIAADLGNPITQIWRWNAPSSGVFYESAVEYSQTATGWRQWVRNDPLSQLQYLAGDAAYLVETATDYTWEIKGRPVLSRRSWDLNGLNLIGFPTDPDTPPDIENFLDAASDIALSDFEIFKYDGLALDANNPKKINPLLYRNEEVARGRAFWMRSGDVFNTYFGPFEVDLSGREGLDFGAEGSALRFRLRNNSGQPLTIGMSFDASESVPVGQPVIDGVPPLLVRGPVDSETLIAGYSDVLPGMGNAKSWNLAPKNEEGSEVEVVLGLDRSAMFDDPGSYLAGILTFTDSLGMLEVQMAVEAEVGSDAGLWVGQALVTEVGQYLKIYESGSSDPFVITNGDQVVTNDLVVSEDGSYSVESINRDITSVPRAFPLRLIVHSPETGNARLLQQVYYGVDVYTNDVITRQQSVLDPEKYDQARRITATHLPWSAENEGWLFDGELAQSNQIATTVITAFNDQRSNPFLHTYHPDHDNLDNRFKQESVQGSESYTLEREITLVVEPPGTNFVDRVSAHQELIGQYLETVRVIGLPRAGGTNDTQVFEARGIFGLSRISTLPVLTDPL